MSTPIITVENLSKRYRLGQIGMSSLRESTERFFRRWQRPSIEKNQQLSNEQRTTGVGCRVPGIGDRRAEDRYRKTKGGNCASRRSGPGAHLRPLPSAFRYPPSDTRSHQARLEQKASCPGRMPVRQNLRNPGLEKRIKTLLFRRVPEEIQAILESKISGLYS